MADQNTSATTISEGTVSRQGTSSPTGNVAPLNPQELEPLPLDGEDLEADTDSAYGDSQASGSTSLRSSIVKGLIEHGRRYQVMRENDINMPSDEKQFDSMEAGHLAYTVIESQQDNPYFRSRLLPNAQHVLDLGTGQGSWAIAVADKFPNLTVHGVDLYPPPAKWVPPNCIFECDDVTKPFTWEHKFDLVHIRQMNGQLPTAEWDKLYKRVYDNLAPGGWIEQVEPSSTLLCDDETMPKDSLLARFAADMDAVVAQTGNNMWVNKLMRSGIEGAGFTKICERDFKFPLGDWPKHPVYKESGALYKRTFKEGLEGWLMYVLTRYGVPKPWSPEEVTVYVAKLRQELDQNWHLYQQVKRVWAQKPFDEPTKAPQEPMLENVASGSPDPTQPSKKKQKTEGDDTTEGV